MALGRKKAEEPGGATPANLDQETRLAAQRIFEERQAKHLEGDELSDWLKAEAEVKKKHKLS